MCNSGEFCLQLAWIVLIIFNVVFLMSGGTLIGLGVWLILDPSAGQLSSLVAAANNSGLLRVSAIIILSAGCAVFFVSILGLVGAILKNKAMLGIYIAVLVIVFCLEIAGAVLAIAFKDWLLDGLENTLHDSLEQPYYVIDTANKCKSSGTGQLWDYVQFKFSCCGIYRPPHSGYERLTYLLRENCSQGQSSMLNVPLTCCQHSSSNLELAKNYDGLLGMVNCDVINSQGCVDKIESWIGYYSPVLIGIGFGVAFLQLIGFIFAVCVCANAPRDRGHEKQS